MLYGSMVVVINDVYFTICVLGECIWMDGRVAPPEMSGSMNAILPQCAILLLCGQKPETLYLDDGIIRYRSLGLCWVNGQSRTWYLFSTKIVLFYFFDTICMARDNKNKPQHNKMNRNADDGDRMTDDNFSFLVNCWFNRIVNNRASRDAVSCVWGVAVTVAVAVEFSLAIRRNWSSAIAGRWHRRLQLQ